MPFNDAARNVALDGLDEAITAGIKYVGVHTLTDPGTGASANSGEATGGSPAYARQAVTWGAAASGQKANTGALAFDVAPGTYAFLTFWNVVGPGTTSYLGYAPINGSAKGFGTVDTAGITSDAIQSAAHGLADGDRVMVFNVFAESVPAGLTEGVVYFVVSSTTDSFKVSLTLGGGAVNVTGQGELFFQKVIPEVFASQGQITVAIGALVLDATGI